MPSRSRYLSCALLLFLAIRFEESHAQLTSPLSVSFNPLTGQGSPPEGVSVKDFPVYVSAFIVRLQRLDEVKNKFTVTLYATLEWKDERAAPLMMSSYDKCAVLCSSAPSNLLNLDGEAACCDGVYIPSAEAINVFSYASQTSPFIYSIIPLLNGSVAYSTRYQGTFITNFNYAGFPWDRHHMAVDVVTDYLPVIRGKSASLYPPGSYFLFTSGVILESQKTGPGFERGALRSLTLSSAIPGWRLGNTWMEMLVFNEEIGYEMAALYKHGANANRETKQGFRLVIEVQRVSRAYYATVVILPTALIVVFSFIIFWISRHHFKARISIVLVLFLTLVILQYTLSSVLPATSTLLSAQQLILVSYIYIFLLLLFCIISQAMYRQHTRRHRKKNRSSVKHHFAMWKHALQHSLSPAVSPKQAMSTDLEAQQDTLADRALVESATGTIQPAKEKALSIRRGTALRNGKRAGKSDAKHPVHEYARMPSSKTMAVEAIDHATWEWFENVQKWSCLRYCRPLRNLVIWYKFIGQSNSESYLEGFSHKVEKWGRVLLFIGYLASIGIIFGIAGGQVDYASLNHIVIDPDVSPEVPESHTYYYPY